MNWMYALYATYEQNRDYVGRIDKEPAHGNRKERLITPLLPLYHSMQNAHITITLNKQGELINASINNQNSQPTIIPVTEASGGRTSGACAHASRTARRRARAGSCSGRCPARRCGIRRWCRSGREDHSRGGERR